MTTLICWVGVDSRGPTSAYLASDSRISWDSATGWNHGQKLFAARTRPEVFGYCGDVVFPSSVLSQVVQMIDSGLLYDKNAGPELRLAVLEKLVRAGLNAYPAKFRNSFSVLYCLRSTEGKTPATFHIAQIDWSASSGWETRWLDVPDSSGLLVALGSGGNLARKWNDVWKTSDAGGTSRAVFSGFCDHLRSGGDPRTGGPPQLVGMYRKGPAKTFGIVSERGLTLLGLPIPDPDIAVDVEWRNELFEICDPRTSRRTADAQVHARPGSLGRP